MSFKKMIAITQAGKALTKEEQLQLARKLGVKFSIVRFCFRLFLLVVGAISIYLALGNNFYIEEKNILYLLIGDLLIAFILWQMIFHPFNKRIDKYHHALDVQFSNRFSKYNEFIREYVDFIPQANGFLQKKRLHLFVDGYNFLVFDDMLDDTPYKLSGRYSTKNNRHPVLRVLDGYTVEKNRVLFRSSDVVSFKIVINNRRLYKKFKKLNPKKIEEPTFFPKDLYSKSYSESKMDNYVEIILEDHTVFRLGISIYLTLKEVLPNKEIRQ